MCSHYKKLVFKKYDIILTGVHGPIQKLFQPLGYTFAFSERKSLNTCARAPSDPM